MATNEAYIEAIKKTGFVLENQIAQQMKANGWTVISNKYYEDDHSGTVREVDLLAYKVRLTPSFNVFTGLCCTTRPESTRPQTPDGVMPRPPSRAFPIL